MKGDSGKVIKLVTRQKKIMKQAARQAKKDPIPVLQDKVSIFETLLKAISYPPKQFLQTVKALARKLKALRRVPKEVKDNTASPKAKNSLLKRLAILFRKILKKLFSLAKKGVKALVYVLGTALLVSSAYLFNKGVLQDIIKVLKEEGLSVPEAIRNLEVEVEVI